MESTVSGNSERVEVRNSTLSSSFRPTAQAISYAWRELARRAGIEGVGRQGTGFESVGIGVHYGAPEERLSGEAGIVVIPCDDGDWDRLVVRAPNTLDHVSVGSALPPGISPALEGPLPILFWGGGESGRASRKFVRRESAGTVVFGADILAATLFMLSRWEEMRPSPRDAHDRFPGAESVAVRQGFLDRPIIDEYAWLLRAWLRELLPSWVPRKRSFAVKLSHDIDTVRPFGSFLGGIRTAAGDVWRRRSLSRAIKTARLTIRQTLTPRRTAFYQGIQWLAEISTKYGMHSAFYFMAARPSGHDSGYDPSAPSIRACIAKLRGMDFEIGFHPGYHTFQDPKRLAEEKDRLDGVLGQTGYGGRQHFLRFQIPETWRSWERLGLAYDSSLTYAGAEGFRCGTCHPYRPFDLEQDRELDLWEVPLIVMDGTLRQYRGLTPEEGEKRVEDLAARCRAVDGVFTLLWHNSSLDGDWDGWAEAYERMVAKLAALQAEKKDRTSGVTRVMTADFDERRIAPTGGIR